MKTMGVDLGTRKVSYALLDEGGLVYAETLEMEEDASRPHQLRGLGAWVEYKAELAGADWVWVESIIVGNNRKYSIRLAEVFGAVFSRLCSPKLGVGTVDNKQWKRDVCGNGNSTKEMITAWVEKEHPDWLLLCNDQDQIDAACIAMYGQEIVSRADGLKLD